MDGLEVLLLRRRLDLLESILEQAGIFDAVVATGFTVGPTPDPGPDDLGRGRFTFTGGRVPTRFTVGPTPDPGPDDTGRVRTVPGGIRTKFTPGPTPDPAVFDIGRLSTVERQQVLHEVNAEIARLQSVAGQLAEKPGAVKKTSARKATARKATRTRKG
jgi:hypothetical protein